MKNHHYEESLVRKYLGDREDGGRALMLLLMALLVTRGMGEEFEIILCFRSCTQYTYSVALLVFRLFTRISFREDDKDDDYEAQELTSQGYPLCGCLFIFYYY